MSQDNGKSQEQRTNLKEGLRIQPSTTRYSQPLPRLSAQGALKAATEASQGDSSRQLPTIDDAAMVWEGKSILVIEDEKQMADLLAMIFKNQGADVTIAPNGQMGLESLREQEPNLLILDMRLPGMDGLEVLQKVRQFSQVPLIIVSAVSHHELMVGGLLAGADDVLKKPFRHDELLARSWSAIRRSTMHYRPSPPENYDDGYLKVDLVSQTVQIKGEPVKLTSTEYRLLAQLLSCHGRVCTFEEILRHVWSDSQQGAPEVVHVFIWQLRQKIEPEPKNPQYLISEHGLGYRFVKRK